MLRNDHGRSRCPVGATVGKLAGVLVVLTVASLAPGAPPKDNDEQSTRICSHTYDEAFQAAQETIERMGLYVTDKDKDKGTISGNGKYKRLDWDHLNKYTFDIHIETLNTKPETRVTINAKTGGVMGIRSLKENALKEDFLSELQKVLSTYR